MVPFTRGPERSRTAESVLAEVRQLVDMGYTEVQFLGQNVNSYRDPTRPGIGFAALMRLAGQVPGLRRLRFTTSHPRDFVRDIVDAIDENPVLCNHVHLPVQSGSDSVLARMRRLYTRDEYLRGIEWMKHSHRDIAITTDIIVGFPGETENEIQATLDLMDMVEYESMFSLKFCPNTPPSRLRPCSEKKHGGLIVQKKRSPVAGTRRWWARK